MDQHREEFRRQLWADLDSGWTTTIEFMTAIGVWMGFGWLVDRWLGTGPWLLVIGAFLGFALGIYLAYVRFDAQSREDEAKRPRL